MALLVVALVLVGLVGNASAALIDRGPDMVYDTVLDITWTRQAGDGVLRNWADSLAWADNLVFGGFDDWRLPWTSVIAAGPTLGPVYACSGAGGADELACRDNEMGYMFYYNLDGVPNNSKTGNQTAVGGEEFTGIQGDYFSGNAFDPFGAWGFLFFGDQFVFGINASVSAWAVRPGDVAAAIPEPSSLLLFGLGALGLGSARRARRRR